jgi:ABC-type nickel/cobalt efflux system permease component RcnA
MHPHCPEGWGRMKIHKGMRILSSMLLMGALAAPLGIQAQERDEHHDRDDRDKNQRIYDRDHKDYHNWNDDEDRNYRQWYSQKYNGREYREYSRLNKRDQSAYWNWRHQHGDNDDHHDNDHHDRDHR